jgi:lipopolysaccharide/colanic/teichoic acid biosynthesis glycosyltransferase
MSSMAGETAAAPAQASGSPQAGLPLLAKRTLDVTLGTIILVLASPLLLLTAGAILLDSGRPVFFRGTRIGRGGRPFTMLKFRSMIVGGDDELHKEYITGLLRDAEAPDHLSAQHKGKYKLIDDPRITRVGRVIRRLSLDEAPQLFHVLSGKMSLVGPRPEVPYATNEYGQAHWRRFEVLPGLTGLWQVSGRAELPPAEMLRLDIEYVEHWSFGLDCRLLLKTIPAVVRMVGSG